ncbi:hypothetical protein Tco_0531127 [Tanacetum coccineum]
MAQLISQSKGEDRSLIGLKSVRYGVSKVLDTAYWGFLGAQIRRIFLDRYGVLDVRTVIFKISLFKLQNACLLVNLHQTLFDVIKEFAEHLKKTSRFVPGAQDRLAEASPLVAQTEYAILNKIVDHAMDHESTVTPVCSSLELLSNTIPSSSAALLEPNEEWVNAMVDGSDHGMTGDVGNGDRGIVFVQGASHVVDGNVELTLVGSEHFSGGPNDVVVALSAGEKGDGSLPSSVVDEEAAATPSVFRFLAFPFLVISFFGPFSIRGGARGMPENTCCSELGTN